MGSVKLNQRLEEDFLNLLTDCLASIQDSKRSLASRVAGSTTATTASTASTASTARDLAFDFVRLQVMHVNQLARLGFAHADLGRRLLESFLDALVPSASGAVAPSEEVFSVKRDTIAKRTIVIEDERWPAGAKVEFRPTCFRQRSDGKEFNHPVAVEELKNGTQTLVTISFKVTDAFMAGREYETALNYVAGSQVIGQKQFVVQVL